MRHRIAEAFRTIALSSTSGVSFALLDEPSSISERGAHLHALQVHVPRDGVRRANRVVVRLARRGAGVHLALRDRLPAGAERTEVRIRGRFLVVPLIFLAFGVVF